MRHQFVTFETFIQQRELDPNKEFPLFTSVGCYPIIYWIDENTETESFCGKCAFEFWQNKDNFETRYGTTPKIYTECGADYDSSVLCCNCDRQLSAYYDDSEGGNE